jgi:hypothetical protein
MMRAKQQWHLKIKFRSGDEASLNRKVCKVSKRHAELCAGTILAGISQLTRGRLNEMGNKITPPPQVKDAMAVRR